MIVAIGFPNPVGWVIDKASGFVGDAATAGFEAIIGGLTAWVVDAVVWVVGGIFSFFENALDPNVQADWFVKGGGPYSTTATIGGALLVVFVFAGIIQGTLAGDVGGMLRRMAVDLPMSIIGMVGLVTITQMLVRLTDELSSAVLGNFSSDVTKFGSVVASLTALNGSQASAFVIFVLGLVTVLAGLVLVAELVVRSALIYIVVALAPLVFATRVWPATKGASRKLLDLLVALIFSKLVIAIALGVAASAAVGSASGGEVTALPTPEVFAENPGGSVTQAVGILLTAAAAFGVSAFSPLLITRVLPLTEAAVVAQGIKGSPVRAAQQGMMMANTAQMVTGRRYQQIATGRAAAGGGAAGGAATAGAAVVSGGVTVAATAASAATRAAATGARAAADTAGAATDSSSGAAGTPPGRSGPSAPAAGPSSSPPASAYPSSGSRPSSNPPRPSTNGSRLPRPNGDSDGK